MINNILSRINSLKNKDLSKDIIPLVFAAYILTNIYYMALHRSLIFNVDINGRISLVQFILIFALCTACLISINIFFLTKLKKFRIFPRLILFISAFIFAVGSVTNKNLDIHFNIVILAVLFYIISYCFGEGGISLPKDKINFKLMIAAVSLLVVAYTIIISHATILRYMCYTSSTFDFGIFAQMFENMAKTGMQITTVERNRALSHFAVHFSPIYYIFLPGYMLFRTPEYLLVIQALSIASAAIPLALIAKKFNFTNEQALILSAAYLFYPTVTAGAFFDFHENKFLTVLILWLFYFIISEKQIFIYVFAVLVLGVKEDSFLYVFFIALYMIASGKKFRQSKYIMHGAIIAVMSLVYFTLSTAYMRRFGLGVMLYRYDIFLEYSQNSFTDIIKNVLKNPSLLFANILTAEKLEFVLYMLLPLCFLPFASKKYKFIILVIPLIIMNLATDYIYQYNINFQYAYGTAALLFYLAVENLSKINPRYISKLCIAMACFAAVLFMSLNYNKIDRYNYIYANNSNDFTTANEILKHIPAEASVTATTFLIPHLIIRHEEVYMGELDDLNEYFAHDTDYIINDVRSIDYYIYNRVLEELRERGYIKVEAGSFLEIFKKEKNEGINETEE